MLQSKALACSYPPPSFPQNVYQLQITTVLPSGPQQRSSQMAAEVHEAILNESSRSTEEKDLNLQNVFIKTQINNIEKFLYLERLSLPRKRKYEENLEKAMTLEKADV
ncbi:Peptide deformylase [Varanus komodoensis]|nr:Peptide deformylase [Varanus komodoensis]